MKKQRPPTRKTPRSPARRFDPFRRTSVDPCTKQPQVNGRRMPLFIKRSAPARQSMHTRIERLHRRIAFGAVLPFLSSNFKGCRLRNTNTSGRLFFLCPRALHTAVGTRSEKRSNAPPTAAFFRNLAFSVLQRRKGFRNPVHTVLIADGQPAVFRPRHIFQPLPILHLDYGWIG